MILLDEATARFTSASRPYGVRFRRWSRLADPRQHLDRIQDEIRPLGLPDELAAFWSTWDPSTIGPPVLDGFIPLSRVVAERRLDCPPCPLILLPLAHVYDGRVWVELATSVHPGGRIFHSSFDDSVAHLWAVGISDLLDVLSVALECDAIEDRAATIDPVRLSRFIDERLDSVLAPGVPRRFEGMDRSRQPEHWRRAEGLTDEHFRLRGRTHTVSELEAARRRGGIGEPATMVGTYRDSIGGGPIRGTVGVFDDHTGSVQVFVPQATTVSGAIGSGGRVEIDVVAMRPEGNAIEAMSTRAELQLAASLGAVDVSTDLLRRLAEEMSRLDTSVIVTAMRPIR